MAPAARELVRVELVRHDGVVVRQSKAMPRVAAEMLLVLWVPPTSSRNYVSPRIVPADG